MVDVGNFDIINHNEVFRSTAAPYRQVIGLIAYFSDTGQAGNDTVDIAARARGTANLFIRKTNTAGRNIRRLAKIAGGDSHQFISHGNQLYFRSDKGCSL